MIACASAMLFAEGYVRGISSFELLGGRDPTASAGWCPSERLVHEALAISGAVPHLPICRHRDDAKLSCGRSVSISASHETDTKKSTTFFSGCMLRKNRPNPTTFVCSYRGDAKTRKSMTL